MKNADRMFSYEPSAYLCIISGSQLDWKWKWWCSNIMGTQNNVPKIEEEKNKIVVV